MRKEFLLFINYSTYGNFVTAAGMDIKTPAPGDF
jgi:hypothetical protein